MLAAPRLQSVVIRPALLPAVGLAAALLVGCSNQPGSGDFLGNAIDSVTPPTPSEAARDAFNVYDADKRRRSIALLSGSNFGGEAPYVRMYRLLVSDVDPTVRAACVRALGLHGTVEDVPTLIAALNEEVSFVRWEAAKALQKIHSPAAIEPLIRAMRNDADADVRMASANALGQYPTPGVFQSLIAALDDPSFSVALAAADALETLTGQELGTDPRLWLAWSDQNPESLFAQRQQYTWKPFHRERGFIDRTLLFWQDRPAPEPRAPTSAAEPDDETNANM